MLCPCGLGEGNREKTDRWRTVGEGELRAESMLLLPGSQQPDVGEGWDCSVEKECPRSSSFLVVLCRNPKTGEGVRLPVWDMQPPEL